MYTYRRYALYLDHHNVEAELAFAAAGARAASFERVTMLREPSRALAMGCETTR